MKVIQAACRYTAGTLSYSLFVLFAAGIVSFAAAQTSINKSSGFPVIRNYLPKDYKAHNQNWAITQDNRGILYFGNSNGLLEFDGNNWRTIKIPNGVVRSLAVDKHGTVFAGSADDFGYIRRKSTGEPEYISLTAHVNSGEPIGHVWFVFEKEGEMLFITDKALYVLGFSAKDYDKPSVRIYTAPQRFRIAHKVSGKIYILERSTGLMEYTRGGLQKIEGSEIFTGNTIFSMLPYEEKSNRILILTRSLESYIYDGKTFEPFKTELPAILKNKNIYLPGQRLEDGNFAINTTDAGLLIMSPEGKIINMIDMKSGLADDGVIYTYHTNGKLWLGLQNGIAVLDVPSPVSVYDSRNGLKGSVVDVLTTGDYIYAATTSGVYYSPLTGSAAGAGKMFTKIPFETDEAWKIIKYKDGVLALTTNGLLQIGGPRAGEIKSAWRGSYMIYPSKYYPGRFYLGLESGAAVIENKGDTWSEPVMLKGLSTAVRYIQEDADGILWLGTSYNGVYKMNAGDYPAGSLMQVSDGYIGTEDEIKIFPVGGKLLFVNKKGVYVFNKEKNGFEPESSIGLNRLTDEQEIVFLLETQDKTIYLASINKAGEQVISSLVPEAGAYKRSNLSFLKTAIDHGNNTAVFSIYKDEEENNIWFCGSDGIVSYNNAYSPLDRKSGKQYSALIRKITANQDTVLYSGGAATESGNGEGEPQFPSDFSSLRFEYSSMNYDGPLARYSYILEGLENTWSAWTTESQKDYTNLPPGRYTFRVKAKDIYDRTGEEAVYAFTIMAPWYLAWYALILYSLCAVLLMYTIVRWRVTYLVKKNIQLENIITERTRVITEQAEKLKEMDEVKSRFFTNISHEFRTPLTLIMGQLEAVKSALTDLPLKKKLEMGYQNAGRLLRLVNQILEISKIESGTQTLHAEEKDLVGFIRHLLFTFESVAEQKGITLEFIKGQEEISVWMDTEKMERVFINLIGNAVKFTEAGGRIRVSVEVLKNEESAADGKAVVIIKDTGIGIAADRLRYIFDRFYQADRSDKSDTEGTGIGLTLVKELIDLHKGEISAESEPGRGTIMTVKLLRGDAHLSEKEKKRSVAGKSTHQANIQKEQLLIMQEGAASFTEHEDTITEDAKDTILVIDDNADIRQYIREQLEEEYTVVEAKDGVSGFETGVQLIPDLIITDVRMPGMDGYELSRSLKRNAMTSHIPVIILTARSGTEDKLIGLETGADDYLVKPFSSRELVLRVKNLISIRKLLRQKYEKLTDINPGEIAESPIDREFLERVIGTIDKNIGEETFGAEQLAEENAISVSQLNRKLNAILGKPAGQLIRTRRMEKAAKLILAGETALKDIAFNVGYSDQSNFTRTFKKHFGKPPGEYLGG